MKIYCGTWHWLWRIVRTFMKNKILDSLIKETRRLLPRHPQFKYYPHFSFIYQNNVLLSKGLNSGHEPPLHLGYFQRIKAKPKMHSEWQSFKKARKRLIPGKPFVCVNVRLNKKGEVKFSKPCECCYNVLKALGCKTFYYSAEGEQWLKIK